MALKFISKTSFPNYICESIDIDENGRVSGASIIGLTVYVGDLGIWKIIDDDLVLIDYNIANTAIQPANNIATLDQGASKIAYVTGDEMHYKLHNGYLWSASFMTTGISSNTTIIFSMQTGLLDCHLGITYITNGDGKIEYLGGVTLSGGTKLSILNYNLNISASVGNPYASIYYNPTLTGTPSVLRTVYLTGGSGGTKTGSISPLSKEFIVPANNQIVVRYTNINGNSGIFNAIMDFYEVG